MAFDLNKVGGYGSGSLGTAIDPTQLLNSYAHVTGWTKNTITTEAPLGTTPLKNFGPNNEIMLHVSAAKTSMTEAPDLLGKYLFTKITKMEGSSTLTLTVDKDIDAAFGTFSTVDANLIVQAITVADFVSLTLTPNVSIAPLAWDSSKKCGGIVVIKCSDTLRFNGGKINLRNAGLMNETERPWTKQERKTGPNEDARTPTSCWENFDTEEHFMLNCGYGAAMLIANNYANDSSQSRIGDPDGAGVARLGHLGRNHAVNGGSTILGIFNNMLGSEFNPSIIAKFRVTGTRGWQGYGRCCLVSNSILPNDEGLYAYDTFTDSTRVYRNLNVRSFGSGELGNSAAPSNSFNNYAHVTGISSDGRQFTYNNKTTDGVVKFAQGALVMFHVSEKKGNNVDHLGQFVLGHIVSDNGRQIILDTSVERIGTTTLANQYECQLITIPQYHNLSINSTYGGSTPWNATSKIGGICAVAVSGELDLQSGCINMFGKGGANAYGEQGLGSIGNVQDREKLPIGNGNGSVFILANKIHMNSFTRIGAPYDGARFGGHGRNVNESQNGGYSGYDWENYGGSGFSGGEAYTWQWSFGNRKVTNMLVGGFGSNGLPGTRGGRGSYQGAHIMIIADTIISFSLHAISTGGEGGLATRLGDAYAYAHGGAGYGGAGDDYGTGEGSGGYNGGGAGGGCGNGGPGGGSSGWAFIYANNTEGDDKTGVIV